MGKAVKFTELKDYITSEQVEPKKQELRKAKIVVEEILAEYEDTRSSDMLLLNEVCKEVAGKELPKEVLDVIKSFESYTRARRKIQADGLYLSDSQIADKRASNEIEVREWSIE